MATPLQHSPAPDGVFHDRADAGARLAELLVRLPLHRPVVLGLPRGGVQVAFIVAEVIRAQLDVVITGRLGLPGLTEISLGAVVDGAPRLTVVNEGVVEGLRVDAQALASETRRATLEVERRRAEYQPYRPVLDLSGRDVIVVDDGVATGATIRAVVEVVARSRPRRILLGVPVAAPAALDELAPLFSSVYCLAAPPAFTTVGAHYRHFGAVSDREVVALLRRAMEFPPRADR